ncbi:S-adenosyl-L-methionine-dependent methyltransferase [Cladochytrium replicatum]|nr:S-adenosyl-L-methionine-dependent methyltransferase [Cladochytrium replicatum]
MSVSPTSRVANIKRNLQWYERLIRGAEATDFQPPKDWEETDDFDDTSHESDEIEEGERENLLHHLVKNAFEGRNWRGVSLGVLQAGAKVLDVGCGTGLWLCEMARDFPAGEYYGVDLKLNAWAETFQRVGGNFTITIGNVLEKLPFDDNTFDYVHQRFLWHNIPEEMWPHAIAELTRVTKPAGYIDVVEHMSFARNCGPLVDRVNSILEETLVSYGINLDIGAELPGLMAEHGGLTDIVPLRHIQTLGWGEDFGGMWLENTRRSLQVHCKFAAAVLQTSEFQVEHIANRLSEDIAARRGTTKMVSVSQ